MSCRKRRSISFIICCCAGGKPRCRRLILKPWSLTKFRSLGTAARKNTALRRSLRRKRRGSGGFPARRSTTAAERSGTSLISLTSTRWVIGRALRANGATATATTSSPSPTCSAKRCARRAICCAARRTRCSINCRPSAVWCRRSTRTTRCTANSWSLRWKPPAACAMRRPRLTARASRMKSASGCGRPRA